MATRLQSFDWDGSMPGGRRPAIDADWSGNDDGVDVYSPSDSTCILIQTANSSYLFLPTAPDERRGLLVGGAVGECPASAIFIGAMPDEAGVAGNHGCLRTGFPAVFDLAFEGRYKRLVTSPVVRLVQIQVGTRESSLSRH